MCECESTEHSDADRCQNVGTAKAGKDEHTHSCPLSALGQVRRLNLPLHVPGGSESVLSYTHRNTHTHTYFTDTLSQRQRSGKREEWVLSEINREIIP